MQASYLINKNVLDLNLSVLGHSSKILFDCNLKKVTAIQFSTSSGDVFVKTSNIFRVSDVIVLQSLYEAIDSPEGLVCPIGKNIYSTSGEALGVLSDIELTKTFSVKRLIAENGSSIKKPVQIASNEAVLIRTAIPKANVEKKPAPTPNPVCLSGSFDFLVGRRCDKPIFDRNKNLLIKLNAFITLETIKKAKENGKLIELALHSK